MRVGGRFPSDRSLVELVRASVKTGGCVCVSLCWVSATGFQEYSKAKRAHSRASNKGDAGRLLI